MDNKFYLTDGNGYIGLIDVANVITGQKWQAIAHYPNNGPVLFYHDTKVDNLSDVRQVIELFCKNNGIKIK